MMNGSSGIYKGSNPQSPKQAGSGQNNKHTNMFPTPHWRDLWAAVAFYIHLAGFVAISAYAFIHMKDLPLKDPNATPIVWDGKMFRYIGLNFVGASITAISLTVSSLMLMYRAPETSLHVSFLASIALSGATAIWMFIRGALWPGISSTLLAIIGVIFYFFFRSRIPFSAILLRTVIDCLKAYPALLTFSAGSIVISLIYGAYAVSTIAVLILLYNKSQNANAGWMLIYGAFSFFWTCQVITNTTQTTIAGVYATFYFLHGTGQAIVNPTFNSLKRALSYSFGSICFGSLIVATIQTIRFLLRMVTDRDSIAGAIVDCILSIIEGLVEYFNYFAYTQIAIYGKSFIEAAKDTWHLIKTRGVDAIVNDDLIGTCLGIATLTIGLAAGLVVYILSSVVYGQAWDVALMTATIFGLMSLVIPGVAFQIIGAGATTTFVCLAEDPAALQRAKPELYNTIVQKYSMINI